MKINLILAPEQAPAELLVLQASNPGKFFYLGKESQLAGTNVLIVDEPDMVAHFKRPMVFNSVVTVGELSGDVIHQIAFQTKDRNDELIAQLVPKDAVLAQNSNGKADYILWSFWPDHTALASFLNSEKFKQMKKLMKNPYTTSYIHVNSAQQLSLTHQMRDFDDKTWWE
ncbi:hypothetical protein [uncultured Leuconostoc sp.]|uniref:hypothetical protein n=1 Tax=uncultured Leuconostoc sp. TaxID=173262 RepID=UPI0025F85789|nr:hypothetical protein [uncultured Leuconostoc sp.]